MNKQEKKRTSSLDDSGADRIMQASKNWFSNWPQIEILDDQGDCAKISREVPIVAIGDPVNLDSENVQFSNLGMGIQRRDLLAFQSSEDEIRVFWRKDGGKCIVGKSTEKNTKDLSARRDFVAKIIGHHLHNEKCDRIVVVLEDTSFFDALDAGLSLLYRYDCFRQVEEKENVHPLTLSVYVEGDIAGFQQRAEKMNCIMHSAFFARDLVNRPPSEKKPRDIADKIREELTGQGLEKIFSSLDVRNDVLRPNFDCSRMGLVQAVCRGSGEDPCVLVAEYCHPKAKNTQPIVFVGKGVCFDSGGINLKQDSKNMKGDMGGAAVVFGILRAAMLLKLPLHLVAIAPFVYNMPSGNAYKPDDVIVAYNGKTVEIGNTDAEGRLILADALAYAVERYTPELIVDYATLTGACVVALGTDIAGVFTTAMDQQGDDWELTRLFVEAGQETDEPHWPLPMYEPYWEKMKSKVANMNNAGSDKWGGAITAALFLKQFVGETPWKHIDIAGPDIFGGAKRFWPEGATGFGVRSGIRFLEKYLARTSD